MYDFLPGFMYKIMSFLLPIAMIFAGIDKSTLDYKDRLGDENYEGIASAYEDYFDIGAAVYSGEFYEEGIPEFITKNFNSLTPEFELKQHSLNPAEGVWDFAPMDKIADFARENNIKLRGHCLIWPVSETWMYFEDAEKTQLVSKEKLYARMDTFMKTVMERYRDVVDSWDVVNEPFQYDRSSQLKENIPVFKIAGEDYMRESFKLAAKYAGDDDLLFVNETFVLGNKAKTDNMFSVVEKLKKEGIRIDGVGIQGHMGTVSTLPFDFNFKALSKIIERCKKLGIKLEVTEMDIKIYENERQRTEELPEWLETWQMIKYKNFFKVCRDNKDTVNGITFWGLDDAHTVIVYGTSEGNIRKEWPMLFDVNGMPKQNFFAVTEF